MRNIVSVNLLCCITALALAVPFARTAQAAEHTAESPWPMFGCNAQHTARSPYVGPQAGDIAWSSPFEYKIRSLVIDKNGESYALAYAKSETGNFKICLYAINFNGTRKWSFNLENIFSIPSHLSPAVGLDGNVYVPDTSGKVYSIGNDGSVEWIYENDISGLPSSVTVAPDGTVYFVARVKDSPVKLHALRPDGTLQWRVDCLGWSSGYLFPPAVGQDGTVYVAMSYDIYYEGHLYAFTPDGTSKWEYITPTNQGFRTPPSVGDDGTIYIGTQKSYPIGGMVYAINANGSLKWNSPALGDYVDETLGIGPDGTIYTRSGTFSKLIALEPNEGKVKWVDEDGYETGIVIDANGTIYVSCQNVRGVRAINPDGSTKWSSVPEWSGPGFPLAIGSDGTLYVTIADELYAFGTAPAPPPVPADNISPATTTNLTVVGTTAGSAILAWTAPGDNGNVGTATTYDIRYSTSPLTEANWGSATQVAGESAPKPAGSPESFIIAGLSTATTYYFVLKTADEVPNWSGLSNVAAGTTVGIRIIQPSGGETWAVGSRKNITWTSSGVAGYVNIYLSRDEGSTWQTIGSESPNDSDEEWLIVGPPTAQARVKVVSVTDTTIFDTSDSNFMIATPPAQKRTLRDLKITKENLDILNSFPPTAYDLVPGYWSGTYEKLLWTFGRELDVADVSKGFSGKYTQLADNNGYLPGECVSAVKAFSRNNTLTGDWVMGDSVIAGGVMPGTVIATFSAPGNKYPSLGGGHAAVFQSYIRDDKGKIRGFFVWDQNGDDRNEEFHDGVVGKHAIYHSDKGVSKADSYNVVQVP